MRRNFRGHGSVIFHHGEFSVFHFANHHRVQSPFLEKVQYFSLASAFRHQQHALLRFTQHDFVRRHAGFALRHFRSINFNSFPTAPTLLPRRPPHPCRPPILNHSHLPLTHPSPT